MKVAPNLELVRPNVWALGLPMEIGIVPYSLCYLIEDADGAMHVVDPGWDSASNWELLGGALAAIGQTVSRIKTITVTHLHPDHLGMAPRLRSESKAILQVHPLEQSAIHNQYAFGWSPSSLRNELRQWGVPVRSQEDLLSMPVPGDFSTLLADRFISDGDILDVPGLNVEVMHTPGHSAGHICLREAALGIILTGDHLLPNVHPGLGLGGPAERNALFEYLVALERVSKLPEYEALPGHGYRFRGITERAGQSAGHHLKRLREVAAIVRLHPESSVWETAEQLTWRRSWDQYHGHARYSALQQTNVYREYLLDSALGKEPAYAVLANSGKKENG